MASVGGAVFVGVGANARFDKSVVANDTAIFAGGGIAADASSAGFGTVTLKDTIVTNNTSGMGNPDLASGVMGTNVGTFISEGYNLIGEIGSANFTPLSTDHESPTGSIDYVVTSVVDTFDYASHGDAQLSLREAVDLANNNPGDEIWVPAWSFALTLDSSSASDHSIAYGDLDIEKTLTIRIAGNAGVQVRQTVEKYQDTDAVFDLWGDFNGDGVSDASVSGSDYLIWQQQNGMTGSNLAADADDDGDVDGDDYDIWDANYSFSLDIKSPSEA